MKSSPFAYHRPQSLDAALVLLAEYGDDAKVLAGGQSLVPLMALRMSKPAHVIDIGQIPDLGNIDVGTDGSVSIGALVRHEQAKRSPEIARYATLVHDTMPWVAHRAIRTRGTVVGSIAHGDPAAEMPAVVLATQATMIATSASGRREIAADAFFEGYLDTALRSDEILTEVIFPPWPARAVGSIVEVARRHGDYALVGLATKLEIDGNTIIDAALSFFGVASTAHRVRVAEETLIDSPANADTFAAVAKIVSAELEPPRDIHGTTAYRKHLAGVLTVRGLEAATARLGAST